MKAEKARLDADGTAQPKSTILSHPKAGWCVGPGSTLVEPELLDNETGERVSLASFGDLISPSEEGETHAVFLTDVEQDLLRRILVKTYLLMPDDKEVAKGLLEKLHVGESQ